MEKSEYKKTRIETEKRLMNSGKYCEVFPVSSGMFIVTKNGKYGACNLHGKETVPCIYEEMSDFYPYSYTRVSTVRIKVNGKIKEGLIDRKGIYIVPPIMDEIGNVPYQKNCPYISGKVNNLWGVINRNTSEVVIPFVHKEEIKGFAKAKDTYIAATCKWVVDGSDEDGNARYSERYGFIRVDGKVLAEPKFYDISAFHQLGYAVVYLEEEGKIKKQFIDVEGHLHGLSDIDKNKILEMQNWTYL